MMDSWRGYIFSVIVCAVVCGIVSQIVTDSRKEGLIRMISGIVLAISILRPISGFHPEVLWDSTEWKMNSADNYIAMGKQTAAESQAACIKASCEEYILDKARAMGAEIMVQVSLDENQCPVFVEIIGDVIPGVQTKLQKILTVDLGIPKENQQWKWNQEKNIS